MCSSRDGNVLGWAGEILLIMGEASHIAVMTSHQVGNSIALLK